MTHTVEIHQYEPTDPRLGRHVYHDSRNRQYAVPWVDVLTLDGTAPAPVKHISVLPITDQGNVGACTGFSDVDLLGYAQYWNTLSLKQQNEIKADPNAWGLKFYSLATQLDSFRGQYPPTDTGSDGPSAAKALQKLGFSNGYQHSFSWASFLAALQKSPVMVGTVWYASMMDTDSGGNLDVDPGSGVAGGHEYVADEITADGKIGCRNHWTADWGLEGRFYIKQTDFKKILADQGDVTVPTPLYVPAPTPTPPPTPSVDADVLAAFQASKSLSASLSAWAVRNGVK